MHRHATTRRPTRARRWSSAARVALSGDRGLAEVRAHIENGLGDAPGGGSYEEVDIYADFQREALKVIDPSAIRPLKVVVDGGNGMAGPMVGPILDTLPVELVETYWVPDGEFPDHEPNPLLPENREFIVRKVIETGADLGHRVGRRRRPLLLHRRRGRVRPRRLPHRAAGRAACSRRRPGADILYDVRASRAVPDTIERLGGRALVNRVGHAFFKTRMRDEGGEFGGEVSGHYYFKAFYNADSGTIPALLILELLSKRETHARRAAGRPALEVLHLRRDQLHRRRPAGEDRRDQGTFADAEITELDGISIDYADWHFNVRPSNTEPLLRLNLESLISQQDMERRRDEILALIRS